VTLAPIGRYLRLLLSTLCWVRALLDASFLRRQRLPHPTTAAAAFTSRFTACLFIYRGCSQQTSPPATDHDLPY